MHWSRQLFLSQIPIYATASVIYNAFRDGNAFSTLYVNRVPFDISEENLEDFEKELIKVNDTMEFPFDDIKITISPTYKTHDEVYGITGFRYGADYVFPVRMLVRSAAEFRSHLDKIFEGATGQKFNETMSKMVTDENLQDIMLTGPARRFLFRRSIVKSTAYQTFTMRYVILSLCVGACYVVHAILLKFTGPVVSLIISVPITVALFYTFFRAYKASQELEFDRKIYRLSNEYAIGCREFLQACIEFDLLMNKLISAEGRSSKADKNPNDGQASYAERLKFLKSYMDKAEYEEKTRKLRQLQ